ncbi:MAG: hypothetical protein P8Y23_18545 [Candidatus Lokiarchaeota archaeon]
MVVKRHKGATFCHVDSSKQFPQERDAIIDGYQKWHGNAPSFSNSAIINTITVTGYIFGWESMMAPVNNRSEPNA